MCNHAYISKRKSHYDKNQRYRIVYEYDTCIFCGHKTTERRIVVKDPPKRKLPYFGEHLK